MATAIIQTKWKTWFVVSYDVIDNKWIMESININ